MNKRIAIGLKLAPATIERIDAYRSSIPFPPTRTAVIEAAVDRYLEAEAGRQPRKTTETAVAKQAKPLPPDPKPIKVR